jgi:hypothetical protein
MPSLNRPLHRISMTRSFRLTVRAAADALIGLALFVAFAYAIGAHERTSLARHHLGDILTVSSSAGDLLKFSLDDSPLIAAAVVATAVPVPHSGAHPALPHTTRETALMLLAAIFSALVALNLAFFRHLRREYASPR